MDIYIDKSNLTSLIAAKSEELYDDCMRVLKKQLNVRLNFKKEDLKNDPTLMAWFSSFSQGVGASNEVSFDSNFPIKPIKSTAIKAFDSNQLSSIYLLEDENTSKLKNTGTVIVGLVGEEIETISNLFLRNEDYDFERKWRIGGDNFKQWEDLKSFSLPLSEIIVVDPFILKNKDTDTDTLDMNLIKFIGVLSEKSEGKVNVIVITHPDNSDYAYDELKKKVNQKLKEVCGKAGSITLIRSTREHDRTILTNYKRIYSGDTFNFWNQRGRKISKGREIAYSSIGKMENHSMAKELISDIQKTIDFLNGPGNNPEFIEGDKISGYLKF